MTRARKLGHRVTLGVYRTRCGDHAVVTDIMDQKAFGTRGYDPRDAIWSLDGTNYFKKYDLIERVSALKEPTP